MVWSPHYSHHQEAKNKNILQLAGSGRVSTIKMMTDEVRWIERLLAEYRISWLDVYLNQQSGKSGILVQIIIGNDKHPSQPTVTVWQSDTLCDTASQQQLQLREDKPSPNPNELTSSVPSLHFYFIYCSVNLNKQKPKRIAWFMITVEWCGFKRKL